MTILILTIINSDASPFLKDVSPREVSVLSNFRNYVVTLLRHKGGTNAVNNYVTIMVDKKSVA